MDIKSGYDFDDKNDRDRCGEAIKRDKPSIVVGSPPCTLFSKLQALKQIMYRDNKMWMLKFNERMEQAKRYVEFCAKIYQFQIDSGCYLPRAPIPRDQLGPRPLLQDHGPGGCHESVELTCASSA